QTRVGIARGPPVLGSVRAGSRTNVERTPTGWFPVGRGIDSPAPAEAPPGAVTAIESVLRSGAAPAGAAATPTATSPHVKIMIRAVAHRCRMAVMALPSCRDTAR